MNNLIVIGVVLFIVAILAYSIYASLIRKKNKVYEAFAAIDTQLKKRYDLIPNILTIAQKFMEHERGLMEDLTKLRTEVLSLSKDVRNINKKIELDSLIQSKLGQFFVSVENYPQLKSDQTMVTAMQTYNEVEEHISAARRFYNSAVLELNNAVEIFPSSLFAAIMGITKQGFFEAESKERKPINASDYLK